MATKDDNNQPKASTAAAPAAPATSPAGRQRAESIGFLAIVAGILVAVNVLGVFFFLRFDTTENRAFSLSEGSKRVVRDLRDELTVTAYFTADLPPPFNATERYVRDILAEYEAASRGRMHVRFVNPDDDEERQEAEQAGVRMMQHQRLESDRVSVVEGFRGLVFEYVGERQTIAALPQETAGLEYAITTAIKQLAGDDVPIGVLSGHESPTPTKGLATLARMLPTYEVREVDAANAIDTNLRALLIVDPQSELTDAELGHVNDFVMQGGSLGVFGGTMKVATDAAPEITAQATGSGLNRMLEHWGVRMAENIVADWRCGNVPLRTPMGFAIPVPYPPSPTISFTDEQSRHPALFRLQGTQVFFASAIETLDAFGTLDGEVLMRTSDESWAISGADLSLRIRDPRQWQPTGDSGPFNIAVALSGRLPSAVDNAGDARSTADTRVLVVGTSTMMRDEFLPPAEQVQDAELAGAMAFALNSVDWLAQDSDLIAVRAKTIEEPPLDVPRAVTEATDDAMEAAEGGDESGARAAIERRQDALAAWEGRKSLYKWGNTLLIPLLVAAFGVIRWQMRQRKKATLKL